jgi:predicted TPR repeat methyltransferase
MGLQDEAAACARKSLSHDPAQVQVWMLLAAISQAAGDDASGVAAYKRATELDGTRAEAWLGLGLGYLALKQFRKAIDPFRAAIALGYGDDAVVYGCLGQALDGVGDFKGAAASFARARIQLPDNRNLMLKQARAQFAVDAIQGSVGQAIEACTRLGLSPLEIDKMAHDVFHLLSAYDYRLAAISIGEWRLARAPEDVMQAYLLAALKEQPMTRAPDAYIVNFFDRFAEDFEHKLVDVLGYQVPGQLVSLAEQAAEDRGVALTRILDLGCGTGLAGSIIARPDRSVCGVDLSPRMLAKARQLGCYSALVESEISHFLESDHDPHDLVIAADVLIYFGDLAPIFVGVAETLRQNGLFAFSTETASEDVDAIHRPSGRFAHSPAYIARLAADAGFSILKAQETTIRLDAKSPVRGALYLLVKAPK